GSIASGQGPVAEHANEPGGKENAFPFPTGGAKCGQRRRFGQIKGQTCQNPCQARSGAGPAWKCANPAQQDQAKPESNGRGQHATADRHASAAQQKPPEKTGSPVPQGARQRQGGSSECIQG